MSAVNTGKGYARLQRFAKVHLQGHWLLYGKKHTSSFTINMLESGVSQWSTSGQVQWPGTAPGPTDDIGQLTFQTFQEQQQMGWNQAIRGRLSKKWGQAYGLYCTSRLHQGDIDILARWMSSLVKSMWQCGIDLWIGLMSISMEKLRRSNRRRRIRRLMHKSDKYTS